MGYIAHDAAIAVIDDYDTDTLAAIEAFRAELPNDVLGTDWAQFLLGPAVGINGYTTYVWAPDGSKEGWGSSDRGDEYRARFVEIVRSGRGDLVHVRFGGDHGSERGPQIIETTDPSNARSAVSDDASASIAPAASADPRSE